MALSLTLVLTPFCKRLAALTGYMDVPKSEGHKLHRGATPLMGGLAMFLGWILTIAIGISAVNFINISQAEREIIDGLPGIGMISSEFMVLCSCAFAALALGMIDDRYPMKAWVKFLGQILIACIAVMWGGIRITLFVDSTIFSWCVSVFWLLFIFNAINFFDNMDGLAVGTAAISFTFFTVAAIVNEQYFVANLSACSAAVTYGFWFYNHAPASIFMGDGGSHFLAFLIGVISSKVTYYNPLISSSRFSILIPLFILAVPVFDAFAVVVIRLYNKKPVYKGDHNHISHRFLHMGMSRESAVMLVHLLAIIGGLGALPLLWGDAKTCLVLIIQGIVLLLFLSILQYYGKLAHKNNNTTEKKAEVQIESE